MIEELRSWVGTPFKHQGRVKGKGVDCVGLAVGVSHDLGITVPDKKGYSRLPKSEELLQMLDKYCEHIEQIEIGAILYMQPAGTAHVAIVTKVDPVYIIHAYLPAGKVIEHRLDTKWERRVKKIYRFPPWQS